MQDHLGWVRVFGHDVRISVRRACQPGDRPPLVLCNGIGASLEVLQPFVDELDQSIDVIRFDVPGVGSSPDPVVPYRFSHVAAVVGRIVTELGYDRFDVLGISWGGGLAQQIAFQFPRRCRRVVLVATATGSVMVPAHWAVLRKMLTPRRYREPDYARSIAAELYGGRMRKDPGRGAHLLQDHLRAGSRKGYTYQLLAGAGWTSLPALPLIRQPVLLLAGSDDPLIPVVNAHIMARLLPHATLHVYDDGHLGLMTLADDLGPRVSRFLLADS